MSAIDMLVGIVMLFGIAIVLIVAQMVVSNINSSGLTGVFATDASGTATQAMTSTTTTVGMFDGIFVVMFAAVVIGSIVAGFMVSSHPVFFFAMMLVNVVMLVIGAMFGNAFDGFVSSGGAVSAAANTMPMTLWLTRYLPLASLIGMIVTAVFAAKAGGGAGGQE